MRVGINACACNHHPSGVMERFAGLYQEVFKDDANEYVVFEPRDAQLSGYFDPRPQVDFVHTPMPSDRTIERFLLGKLYWRRALGERSIHVLDTHYLPLVKHRKGVTFLTIHDLRYVRYAERYSLHRRIMGRQETRAGILRADVVITVSEAMKAEILAFEPRATVRVLPNAVNWDDARPDDERDGRAAPRIVPSPYVLAVGHLERRKNYPRLIEAFEKVAQRGYAGDLCIIGNPAGDQERVRAGVAASASKDRIHVRGGISRGDLERLYREADVFVFPSSYEGFGIPVLEAMKFGCPFVLSDLPVFREITADKAVYFQPSDVGEMAEKIWAMLNDASLRRACRALADERRPAYSWKSVAKSYLGLLREFAN